MSHNITLTSKGQLTLPIKIRKALGIDETHRTLSLRFDEQTKTVTLEKPVSFAEIRAYVQKHARNKQPVDLENIHERFQDYRLEQLKERGIL
jgi:bifunctional DNA-binding transcriptional regulator/antitoxin component of YhaV-PrlF toxin-antitoxin module